MQSKSHWVGTRCSRVCRGMVASIVLGLLTACGPGNTTDSSTLSGTTTRSLVTSANASVAVEDIAVINIEKIGETRVSRTVFDYVFRVSLKNNAQVVRNDVVATVTGSGRGTTIIDGEVRAGTIAAGTRITASDTITLRHDRNVPFSLADLKWQVSAGSDGTTVPGILLPGTGNGKAVSVLQDYIAARAHADLATAVEPGTSLTFYTKELQASINKDATIDQVNAALRAVGARIAFSRLKNPLVTLQLPNHGTIADLERVAATLMATGSFDAVSPVFLPQPVSLPANVTPAEALAQGEPVNLLHQTSARVAAAWPAPSAPLLSNSEVEMVVVDFFGGGTTPDFLNSLGATATPAQFNSNGLKAHGYHVLGIIAGSFGGSTSAVGKVTGVLPVSLRTHVVDLVAPIVGTTPEYKVSEAGVERLVNALEFIQFHVREILISAPLKRFVLNFSLGYCNGTASSTPACPELTDARVQAHALNWRRFTDAIWPRLPVTAPFDYQGQVVQVSAAGNNFGRRSNKASFWNASALMTIPIRGGVLAPLSNGLVVENRVVSPLTEGQRPFPGCLAQSSNKDGNIGAIGTNVFSFTGPSSTGLLTGTSMAAPQASGLAAWMLTVRPTLAPATLIQVMRNASFSASATDPCTAQPMIDALAALLNLDVELAANVFDAPTRLRLLQPSGATPGPVFQAAHAQAFLRKIFPAAYPPEPLPAANASFSEFDLNGDGFTGDAARRAPFDLKFNRSDGNAPSFDVLTQYPNGTKVTIDEKSVSDFEVLCYYVNSSLFDSSPAQVEDFLEELRTISAVLGRTVSCAAPAPVVLKVLTTNPSWTGLPATIVMSNFQATTKTNFNVQGSPGNTCGGERGFPAFSTSVDSDAAFFAASLVSGLPVNLSGPGVNRRPCSSFYAVKSYGGGLPEQVWINATGRGQRFGGATLDWEIQVRYSNGDPRGPTPGLGKQCEVGVVPNSGFFAKNFDAVCTHELNVNLIMQ